MPRYPTSMSFRVSPPLAGDPAERLRKWANPANPIDPVTMMQRIWQTPFQMAADMIRVLDELESLRRQVKDQAK